MQTELLTYNLIGKWIKILPKRNTPLTDKELDAIAKYGDDPIPEGELIGYDNTFLYYCWKKPKVQGIPLMHISKIMESE